jgi:heptaprenyl diphosphate synthase
MTADIKKVSRLALLLALAIVIHTAEGMLPITVLWFKFGFANIVGLATLYIYGFKEAFALTLGRIILGSLLLGLFASPAFMLSFSGGTAGMLAMGLVNRFAPKLFSEIGTSIIGAVFHNLGQLAVAYLVLVRNEGIFWMAPLMLIAALGTGFINGLAARFLIDHIRNLDLLHH